MDTIIELNEIEQIYYDTLEEINFKILNLIDDNKNNSNDHVKLIMKLINNEPEWHNYLMHAQYALSGDYPDEECIEHAISFGEQMLKGMMNSIIDLPNNTLETILIYINDHKNNHKCILCEKL